MRGRRSSCYIILLFFLVACNYTRKPHGEADIKVPEQSPVSLSFDEMLDSVNIYNYFKKKFDRNRFSGTFLFAKNDKIICKGALGYSDVRTKDSLTINSAFQLASVSKPLTAIGVMLLVQEGKLDIDDSLAKFFPDFEYNDVTVRQLLTHKSGLPEYFYFCDDLWNDWGNPLYNDDVLCLINKHCPPRYYLPGRRYDYCNTNFMLLAKVIERVSKLKFSDYMREHVFEPFGMENTFVYSEYYEPAIRLNGVTGHEPNKSYSEISYLNGVVGDKGTYSTVDDMYKLDQKLRRGEVLNDSLQQLMYEPQHRRLHDWDNYGLGWRINSSEDGNKVIYHSGWWKGFKTTYIREEGSGKTIVVLTNYLRYGYLRTKELRELF